MNDKVLGSVCGDAQETTLLRCGVSLVSDLGTDHAAEVETDARQRQHGGKHRRMACQGRQVFKSENHNSKELE